MEIIILIYFLLSCLIFAFIFIQYHDFLKQNPNQPNKQILKFAIETFISSFLWPIGVIIGFFMIAWIYGSDYFKTINKTSNGTAIFYRYLSSY